MTYRILSGPHHGHTPSGEDDYYVIREDDGTEQIISVVEHERLLDALAEARAS